MIHISELSDHRVNLIEDEVKVGDEITAKVIRTKTARLPFPARPCLKPRPDRPQTGRGILTARRDAITPASPLESVKVMVI